MYSRAGLCRTVVIVVALLPAATATRAGAREFRAADTEAVPFLFRSIAHLQKVLDRPIGSEILDSSAPENNWPFRDAATQSGRFMPEKWSALEQQSRQRAKAAGVIVVTDIDGKPFEAATAGIYAKAQRDPAAAELIERIRKVE